MMLSRKQFASRSYELKLLLIVLIFACLGFITAEIALQVKQGFDPSPALPVALLPALTLMGSLFGIHLILRWQDKTGDPYILPITGLLTAIGLLMLWWLLRISYGIDGWRPILLQMMNTGVGLTLIVLLNLFPSVWLNKEHRDWSVLLISLAGLSLLLLTAFVGTPAAEGSDIKLALKIGPLSFQTSEIIKLALIIFLAWYIDTLGEEAAALAGTWGGLKIPALKYWVPGALFVGFSLIALVLMHDLGALPVLLCLFVALLYVGLDPRIFRTVVLIGVGMTLLAGLLLLIGWQVPDGIQNRIDIWFNPWNRELTGSGQIRYFIYTAIAGGIFGRGIGSGFSYTIPAAATDGIFPAILADFGLAVGLALLALYAILILRIFRVALRLPTESMMFERLLLVGIGVHLFAQVFVMVGGAFTLLPLTGITTPLLSVGGTSRMVNLAEIGAALALAQVVEGH